MITPGCVQLSSAHKSNIGHKSASCTMYQAIKLAEVTLYVMLTVAPSSFISKNLVTQSYIHKHMLKVQSHMDACIDI